MQHILYAKAYLNGIYVLASTVVVDHIMAESG